MSAYWNAEKYKERIRWQIQQEQMRKNRELEDKWEEFKLNQQQVERGWKEKHRQQKMEQELEWKQKMQSREDEWEREEFRGGTRWAIFSDLSAKICPLMSEADMKAILHNVDSMFKSSWFSENGSVAECLTCERQGFAVDIFGNYSLAVEIGHLIPIAKECNKYWYPYLATMMGLPLEMNHQQEVEFVQKILQGVNTSCGIQTQETGLLYSPVNFIMMENQRLYFDELPSVMLLPVLSPEEMISWRGSGYVCLVICLDDLIFRRINASQGVDDQEIYEHSLKYDDPWVEFAFKSFEVISLISVAVMRNNFEKFGDEFVKQDTSSRLCRSLHEFISQAAEFPVPEMKKEFKQFFRYVAFDDAAVLGPDKDWKSKGHPAPHPWLLAERSLNSWTTFLYKNRKSPDYPFLQNMSPPTNSGKPARSCAIFPSCKDCDIFACPLCLANDVYAHRIDYPPLDTEEFDWLCDVVRGAMDFKDPKVLEIFRSLQSQYDEFNAFFEGE